MYMREETAEQHRATGLTVRYTSYVYSSSIRVCPLKRHTWWLIRAIHVRTSPLAFGLPHLKVILQRNTRHKHKHTQSNIYKQSIHNFYLVFAGKWIERRKWTKIFKTCFSRKYITLFSRKNIWMFIFYDHHTRGIGLKISQRGRNSSGHATRLTLFGPTDTHKQKIYMYNLHTHINTTRRTHTHKHTTHAYHKT